MARRSELRAPDRSWVEAMFPEVESEIGSSNGPVVAQEVWNRLTLLAASGDRRAGSALRLLALDGLYALWHTWSAQEATTVHPSRSNGEAVKMPSRVGVREGGVYQAKLWIDLDRDALMEVRNARLVQGNILISQARALDEVIALMDQHGARTAREACVAAGIDPADIDVGLAI